MLACECMEEEHEHDFRALFSSDNTILVRDEFGIYNVCSECKRICHDESEVVS